MGNWCHRPCIFHLSLSEKVLFLVFVFFALLDQEQFQAQSRSICLVTNNTFKIQTKDAPLFFSLYCFLCSGDRVRVCL